MYTTELLEEAKTFMFHMLTKVVEYGGSDLFITADFPPSIKLQGLMRPLGQQALTAEKTKLFAYSLMNDKQRLDFENDWECNFAINVPNVSRFRVNVFKQQLQIGMVIRTITSEIPTFQKLKLPESLKNVIMEKTGRGVTYWMGKGAYTDTEQYILFCAVNKYEIRNFKKIVNEIDPKAFVTISEDQEIDGGFEKRL